MKQQFLVLVIPWTEVIFRKLNKAPKKSVAWCEQNPLVPRPKKCEGMILNRTIAVDDELMWEKNLSELKEGFANKLSLKRGCKGIRFVPKVP